MIKMPVIEIPPKPSIEQIDRACESVEGFRSCRASECKKCAYYSVLNYHEYLNQEESKGDENQETEDTLA